MVGSSEDVSYVVRQRSSDYMGKQEEIIEGLLLTPGL